MIKFGFINNLNSITIGEEQDSLLVTVNGGESFKGANIVFPLDIKDTLFYVYEEPKIENGRLKMKLFAPENIGSKIGRYYEFASIDNGLNWLEIENKYYKL